ncbi:hypothetical protein ACS0TY_004691 [Phlomoides rotata]
MDELSGICNGLGLLVEDKDGNRIGYDKGEFCLDNMKDLLRFLRRDDQEKRDVFKQVCKWNIVGKDLIPIMEYYTEDRNLVLNAVKVLVFLTMPVEPTSHDISQQTEYLWGLKSAITLSGIVPVIMSLLENPLENLESESFTEDDWKLVQLILTLFRNVIAIQDISTQQIAGASASQFLFLRDRFLELLFQENVMDLILVLSQHTGGSQGYLRQDNLLLLEFFYYTFKGQEPELIAKAHLKGSKVEEEAENPFSSLQSIMKEEQEKRRLARLRSLSCYSQFTGTYTKVTLDGSKALLKGNPSASSNPLLKAHQIIRGPSKREIWDHKELPSTKSKILQLLDDFTSQFLMGGYNVLMQSILEDIVKEHQEIQSSDIIIFFKVAEFVTSFQYHKCITTKPSIDAENEASTTYHDDNTSFKGSICGPIAETLNESMFSMVISKWRYAFEALKQTNNYKLLSAAGSLTKVMIRMLDLVLKQSPEDSKETQTARILLYKLFYDQTEEGMTQFLLNLIKSFDTHKQSKSDLANLVETMHVVLRLLETLQERGTLRVSKKLRKKKKKAETKNENVSETSMDNVNPQKEVDSSTCEESVDVNMLEKETLTSQNVDIETDTTIRDSSQVDEPAPKPANPVDSSTCEESVDVNMLEKETLTSQNVDIETDTAIRDSSQVDEPAPKPANPGFNDSAVDDKNIADNSVSPETDESSGDEQPVLTDEVDFRVSSVVSALGNNNIVQKLCWLLKFYKNNSITTNHYILSMLRRICDDLGLDPMLYQLSFLTIFYDILEEQKARPCKEYENIVTFLTTLIRRMLRKMKSNPLLFVEVLFQKTRKECHYINCGSMPNELKGTKNKAGESRNDTNKGGNGFFEDQQWVRRNIADALGDDDYEINHLDGQEEMFRQSSGEGNEASTSILNDEFGGSRTSNREGQSKEGSVRSSKRGKGHVLSDEINERLKDLYEKYKGNPDCCKLISEELDPDGVISKMQVSKRLKQLGFKVPAKAKRSDASSELLDNEKDLSKGSTDPNSTLTKKRSSLSKPMHSRKRVHAFSDDQEQKIKDLFEQFKDHKRCSYMIANALDGTGTISTAQISRKLKQLGLVRPKRKKSTTLRDEALSDISSDGAGKSDDETLLSIRNRGKQKGSGRPSDEMANRKDAQKSPEDISDDEPISSLLVDKQKRNGSPLGETAIKKVVRKSPEGISDDESLGSLLVKTKKVSGKSEDEDLIADVFEKNLVETNFVGREAHIIGRDEDMDELADFDEEMEPVNTVQDNSALKRRKRMVIDLEDDDE